MEKCFYCDEVDGHMDTCVRLVDDEMDILRTALAEAEREIEELRADVVWAAENGVQSCDDNCMLWDWYINERGERAPREAMGYADLCRAIREARRGE